MNQNTLTTGIRALILSASFWLISLNLTVLSGSLAAVLGCVAACVFADRRLQQPPLAELRVSSLLLLSLLVLLLGTVVGNLFASTSWLAALLAPITAFNTGEFVKWLALALSLTFALRVLSKRTGFGAILEILFVASAFVWVLAAHRNGMIHRPFFIGDFALIRGIDPSTILMGFGGAAVLALAALLILERNVRRLPYHFAILALLCLSLVGYVRLFGLPTPQLTNDLGLTGQEQTGRSTARENPFRDGENSAEDREAPVAVVVFRDDYEPIDGAYYFRESAYSQFNGTMLDFARREDMDRDLIENFTNSRADTEQLPGATDQRKSVRTTIGMLVPHRSPFGLVSPVAYENRPNPNNLRFKRTYDSYSLAPEYSYEDMLDREVGREDWSQEVLQEYLTLPDDPRYGELARQLIGNLRPEYSDDPFARAWAIKSYLDENGIYSLANEHAYETDPAASFLFGDLTGYCMHFSFAATYLYRSIGIPARVGIGYSVPANNRGGGSSLLIQAVHGHAWPEIYFRDVGWVIVDPAPQQTLVDMSTDPQNDLQQMLGDMLRDDPSFDDYLDSQQTSFIDLTALRNALAILAAFILLGGYAVKGYRLWIPGSGRAEQQYRLSYRAALDNLAAVGIHRQPGESREQFARRASQIAPGITQMTDAHLAAALGENDRQHFDAQTWRSMR
ncbi:MAG: transglutaminase-like domain-containing protein, partial [Pseudohongiellaceae bacterium]